MLWTPTAEVTGVRFTACATGPQIRKKRGSWGLFTQYFNQGAATVISHPMYGDTKSFPLEGYKGYVVGGNVTLAPNMVADVEWYDLKGKKTGKHSRTLWSMLNISF